MVAVLLQGTSRVHTMHIHRVETRSITRRASCHSELTEVRQTFFQGRTYALLLLVAIFSSLHANNIMGRPDEGLLETGTWQAAKPERVPRSSPFVQILTQFIRPAFLSKASGARPTKLRRTSYLDGIRGFAALMVYLGHHQLWAHEALHSDQILENGFGYDRQYYFAAFPGIRTFFIGGHYAVCTFFVISGYVLSAKPLSLIHADDHLALGDNVASALFRRWIRLNLPLIVTTFGMLVMWHGFGVLPNFEPQRTFREEVWHWYCEFKNFSFVFRVGGEPWLSYHFHSWSIPVEMKGSIVVYTAVMAFSRATHTARLWCEVVLIGYFMYIVDGGHFAMFVAGMMLCDLDLLSQKDNQPGWMKVLKPAKKWLAVLGLVLSILLGGCPSYSWDIQFLRDTPGWYYLSKLAPQAVFDYKWFYLFWAAVLLVASVPRIPPLKRFFESKPCQYLGRVSYAFYLFHGPILWTLGDRMYAATGMARESHALGIPGWVGKFPLPRAGPFGLEPAFLLCHVVLLPVTLWLSELGTVLIDEPSIKFAAWCYRKALGTDP